VRFLLEHPEPRSLDDLVESAQAAHRYGLDGVLLREWPQLPGSLVSAAALGARVDELLVAADVRLGDRHPLEVAEEAAVVDLALGGRLILVVRPAPGVEERFTEALDLLRHAFAARPFRFEGRHWRVPANLPENVWMPEERVRMAPSPAQPRLEVWTAGADGLDAGIERGLGHLADAAADETALAAAWRAADAAPASIGAPRGRCGGWTNADELIARLRAGRESFGQDWAAVAAPAEAASVLGSIVRPRVQMHALPPGLEAFWDAERPWEG